MTLEESKEVIPMMEAMITQIEEPVSYTHLGYQETSGEPVFQPRRPNSRLDKIRHMFQKIM